MQSETQQPPSSDRDITRIIDSTFVAHVEWHDELPSTNDRALALPGESRIKLPCLVIADRQTQGRGRGGNVWWSSSGALTFSLLLELFPGLRNQESGVSVADSNSLAPDTCPLTDISLPPSRWPEMSLTIGSSVCAALSRRFPGEDVRLKWPNDVYLRGAKVCGVLIETGGRGQEAGDRRQESGDRGHGTCIVIGIGINVNNSAAGAPDELRNRAIALCDIGGPQPVIGVLIDVLQELGRQVEALQCDAGSIRSLWRRFDLLLGRTVTIDAERRPLTGTCLGIDDDGALLLQTAAGPRRCYGGVVQSFT